MRPGRRLGPRRVWRAGVCVLQAALWALLAATALAQDIQTPLLVIDQERLFLESSFGKASLAREREATEALERENSQIEAALVEEEQALTTLRATLSVEEFSARADAFDDKVERIRSEQDAKARVLAEVRQKDSQKFREVAIPVLAALMQEKRAVAIIDKSMAILSVPAIDVTDEAIAKVDAVQPDPAPLEP